MDLRDFLHVWAYAMRSKIRNHLLRFGDYLLTHIPIMGVVNGFNQGSSKGANWGPLANGDWAANGDQCICISMRKSRNGNPVIILTMPMNARNRLSHCLHPPRLLS